MAEKSFQNEYFRFAPHSIEDRTYWEEVKNNPKHGRLLEHIKHAMPAIPSRPKMMSASDVPGGESISSLDGIDACWQEVRKTLSVLAMDRCMRGINARGAGDRLLNWIDSLLEAPTWSEPSRVSNSELSVVRESTLDLAACRMACLMAEMLEVLGPWMDSVSGSFVDRVSAEIHRRVLEPYGEGVDVWWHDWDAESTNHSTGVCAGAMLAACESLSVLKGHEKARARALDGLKFYLQKGFTEHGECDEGMLNWVDGMGHACMGWGRLTREEAESLIDVDRLNEVSGYPGRTHLFGNTFYSGSDGGLLNHAAPAFVSWLAEALAHDGLRHWAANSPRLSIGSFSEMIRALDVPKVEAIGVQEGAPASPRNTAAFLEDQQVALLRTETSKGEMVAVLTGGNNAERDNHNDLGHFFILHQENVVVPDVGVSKFCTEGFPAKRHAHLASSSRGHCCPEINGLEQRDGKDAQGKVLSWTPDAEIPRLVLDLTSAYGEAAGLAGWTRSLECWPADPSEQKPSRMVLTDVFRTHQPQQRIEHTIWSCFKPVNVDERLDFAGIRFLFDSVICDVAPSPMVIAVDEIDADAQGLASWPGQTLYRLSAVYRTNEKGKLQVQTTFFA